VTTKTRRHVLPPPALLAIALLVTILLGTILLRLPFAQTGPTLSWLDALFTATSATCVTGLVVVDTGTHFTFPGQVVILILIQIGGLGVMTIGTVVLLALGQRPTAAVRQLLTGFARHRPTIRIRDILGTVFLTTIVVESIGAGLLFLAFARTYPAPDAAWLAVFHSVSAFCNAGFALWSDSFMRYADDSLINLTVMTLIIVGGLGFVVVVELRMWIVSRLRRTGAYEHLSLHSRIILTATTVALVGGGILILGLEMDNVLAGRPWLERLFIASFQSVTARTAGFNTVDIAALSNPTLLVLITLMFIGAGPGSMAGGIKLTSATVVLALVGHRMRGNRDIRLFGRAIGEATLQRAVVLSFLAMLLIGVTVGVIEAIPAKAFPQLAERGAFLEVVFETVSAFGTVGLSMGITAKLGVVAKFLIIGLMFIGRLGPLALMDFFEHLPPAPPVRYAKEDLMVG
jgi:trk system potassium uptake protein TrkH